VSPDKGKNVPVPWKFVAIWLEEKAHHCILSKPEILQRVFQIKGYTQASDGRGRIKAYFN